MQVPRHLARPAPAREDGVMVVDGEPGLLRGDVPRDQGDGHIDVDQEAATGAVDMVVPVNTLIEPAGLVGEGQLLDNIVAGQHMKRAIDRPVGDLRVLTANTFKDFPRGQVAVSRLDFAEDHRALGGVPVGSNHEVDHLSRSSCE